MPSRTPYTDASLNGRDGQSWGDPVHVTTQPLTANSISAGRIMPENLKVEQNGSFGSSHQWGQGKYGVYELSSGLIGPMTNIAQRQGGREKAPHGGSTSKLHYNSSTT